MFRQSIRRFATAAESASPYGIMVGKVQGKVNGFVGGTLSLGNVRSSFTTLLTMKNNHSDWKHPSHPSEQTLRRDRLRDPRKG